MKERCGWPYWLLYIWVISFFRDIKRVFAYHGAEHMAVHAYEAGLHLDVTNVRKFGTPHPRCGTAFLLTVMLVSIVVFALLMGPPIEYRILSRIVLIPVIAAISYEIIRFSGAHQDWPIAQIIGPPRAAAAEVDYQNVPGDDQIEVAICAVEGALAADEGREYTPDFGRSTAEATYDNPSGVASGPGDASSRRLDPRPSQICGVWEKWGRTRKEYAEDLGCASHLL